VTKDKVLFVHQDPLNEVHRGFGESIGADFIPYNRFKAGGIPFSPARYLAQSAINGLRLPRYKYYLCDGGATVLNTVVRKKTSMGKKAKIIDLIADETFFVQAYGIPKPNPALGMLWSYLSGNIDGGIAVSELIRDAARKFLDCPIRVVHPFIRDKLYERLVPLAPRLDKDIIISLGYAEPKNGMDILVEAFRTVRKDFKDAELVIIGKGHPREWEKIRGVKVAGFVDDLVPYFEMASIFVLVGRGQAFPAATLESMCAGVPAIVTEHTGTKVVTGKLGNGFVRRADAGDIAVGISDYLSLPIEERAVLGRKAKGIGKEFNGEKHRKKFHDEFYSLVDEIA